MELQKGMQRMSSLAQTTKRSLLTPGVVALSDRLSPLALDAFGWHAAHGPAACTVVAKLTYALSDEGFVLANDQDALTQRAQPLPGNAIAQIHRPSDYAPFKELADVCVAGTAALPAGASRSARAQARLVVSVPLHPKSPGSQPSVAQLRKQGRAASFAPQTFGSEPNGRHRGQAQQLNCSNPAWREQPLPASLDPRCFNDAPADQRMAQLAPNPLIHLENFHPNRLVMTGRLPNLAPLAFSVQGDQLKPIALTPDTLWIDVEHGRCTLTWRGSFPLGTSPRLPQSPIYVALSEATSKPTNDELRQLVHERRVQSSGVHRRVRRGHAAAPTPPPPPSPRAPSATLAVAPAVARSMATSPASSALPFRENSPSTTAPPVTPSQPAPPASLPPPMPSTATKSPWTNLSQPFVPRLPQSRSGDSTPPPMLVSKSPSKTSLPEPLDGPLELLCWDDQRAGDVAASKTLAKVGRSARSTNEVLRAVFDASAGSQPRLNSKDMLALLKTASPLAPEAHRQALTASLDNGDPLPIQTMYGHLVFQYDAFAALEALLAAMGPVLSTSTGDSPEESTTPLETTTDKAHQLLKSPYRCPEWATTLSQTLQQQLSAQGEDIEAIRGRMNRMLIRKRAYRFSEFGGRRWFRATLRNGNQAAPVYVPSDFAATMPFFPSLSAKVMVEISPPRAQSDKGHFVLTAIAIARCIATKEL